MGWGPSIYQRWVQKWHWNGHWAFMARFSFLFSLASRGKSALTRWRKPGRFISPLDGERHKVRSTRYQLGAHSASRPLSRLWDSARPRTTGRGNRDSILFVKEGGGYDLPSKYHGWEFISSVLCIFTSFRLKLTENNGEVMSFCVSV